MILEPAAVLDLVGQMFMDFSGTAIARRAQLPERPHRREALRREHHHLRRCAPFRCRPGAPFDGEGVPRSALTLVEEGVPRQSPIPGGGRDRAGAEPTGHGFPLPNEQGEAPVNIVIAGGSTSVEEMIASTPNGILVTRLWYIREVEPYEKIMTGHDARRHVPDRRRRDRRRTPQLPLQSERGGMLRNVESLTASGARPAKRHSTWSRPG